MVAIYYFEGNENESERRTLKTEVDDLKTFRFPSGVELQGCLVVR